MKHKFCNYKKSSHCRTITTKHTNAGYYYTNADTQLPDVDYYSQGDAEDAFYTLTWDLLIVS